MSENAKQCEGCNGCQWQGRGEGDDWCYFFEKAPSELPCGQHDQFETIRKINQRVLMRNPALLSLAIMGALEEATLREDQ